jgi:hypothetical protein
MPMLGRWSLCFLSLIACHGSSDAPGQPSLSIRTTSFGTFGCARPPFARGEGDSLSIVCSAGSRRVLEARRVDCILRHEDNPRGCVFDEDRATLLSVEIRAYHGPDTYTFEGSPVGFVGSDVTMRVGDQWIASAPGGDGAVPTLCVVDVTGPDALSAGSLVKGHVRCKDMSVRPANRPDPSGQSEDVEIDFAAAYRSSL